MESGGCGRRRPSLSGEKVDSANLRDFLRVKQDDDGRNLTGVTLSAMLGSEKRATPSQVNRTLLDIIRDDPNGGEDNKKSWKAFRDKLRLRRAGATWTSTVPTPASDIPIQNSNRMMSRRNSTRFPMTVVNSEDRTSESNQPELSSSSMSINGGENRSELNSIPSNRAMMVRRNSSRVPSLSANLYGRGGEGSTSYNTSGNNSELRGQAPSPEGAENEEEEEEETEESAEGADEGGEQPVRMSLMALLAETDRQMGLEGSAFMMDDEEDEEEEEEEEVERGGGGREFNCCVCMVRHKGSAFIPCGHTFCRLCSRELWVQRGNCPLCNGFILEILDIF